MNQNMIKIAIIKSSRLRPGFSEIFIPGEIEKRRTKDSDGKITILKSVYEEIVQEWEGRL